MKSSKTNLKGKKDEIMPIPKKREPHFADAPIKSNEASIVPGTTAYGMGNEMYYTPQYMIAYPMPGMMPPPQPMQQNLGQPIMGYYGGYEMPMPVEEIGKAYQRPGGGAGQQRMHSPPKIKILLPKISSEHKVARMLTAFNSEMEEREMEYEKTKVFIFSICPKSRKVLILLQPMDPIQMKRKKKSARVYGGFEEKRNMDAHMDSMECAATILKQKELKHFFEQSADTKKKIIQLLAIGSNQKTQAAGSHLHNQRYLKELFESKNEDEAMVAFEHIIRGPYRSRSLYVEHAKDMLYFVPLPYFAPSSTMGKKSKGPKWVVLQRIIDGIQAAYEQATRQRSNSSSSIESTDTSSMTEDISADEEVPMQVPDILATADRVKLSPLFTDPRCYVEILEIFKDIQQSNELQKPPTPPKSERSMN